MTARELRDALAQVPEEILDRPVTWNSEYFLGEVVVAGGGMLFREHLCLGEWAPTYSPDTDTAVEGRVLARSGLTELQIEEDNAAGQEEATHG